MKKELRILLADDHEILRRGLRDLIETQEGWVVCGEAADGRTATELARELRPDVVVMDIGMPLLNGLDATRAVRKECPTAQVLILSMHESEQIVREVLASGARGYVMKSDASKELIQALGALQSGGTFFSSGVAKTVERSGWAPRGPRSPKRAPTALTRREREIVQLLAEGKSNKATALHLEISVKTVETHRARIMSKLQMRSFAELVLYAIRNHLVQP
jgi:DNA-binding NarL/FixJ family response regulator